MLDCKNSSYFSNINQHSQAKFTISDGSEFFISLGKTRISADSSIFSVFSTTVSYVKTLLQSRLNDKLTTSQLTNDQIHFHGCYYNWLSPQFAAIMLPGKVKRGNSSDSFTCSVDCVFTNIYCNILAELFLLFNYFVDILKGLCNVGKQTISILCMVVFPRHRGRTC